ncbi:hypothetical protein G9A89_006058 [Geosiphon pyriformis]|nr:hypothetical protein G9A89_006058 [Geosiphon pyriformis]
MSGYFWSSETGNTIESESVDIEENGAPCEIVKIHLFPYCMGDYLYLPQQSEECFAAHNRNDLDFIKLNPLSSCLICFPLKEQSSRQFQDFWNWFLNEHSAETYTAYTTYYFDQAYFENDFEERNNSINQFLYFATFEQQHPDFKYLNHQIHIWIAAHQATETPFETEEESYQTAPVFDLLSNESDSSTQTIIPKPMANNFMQANILAALQGIQTALGAATANQYDDEYKFQIVGGYLQGSSATWFSQETDVNAQQRIIRWTPANVREISTSFTTRFENKFRIPILISKWRMELEKRTQDSSEVVTEYAKAIRKLRTNLSYALWLLLALKDNPTMDMAIELAQRIEDNQRMHLGSILPVFAPVSVMAPASQMAATSFAIHTQDPNEQLIDRLTANLARLLELLAQAVRENQQPQRPRFEPRFNQPQQPPYQRQQNCDPPVCYHSFKLEGAPPKDESASQPGENPFYAFNLTNDNHDIDELAINPSESIRKNKKAKVDFVLDPNKASTSTADNNEPPKAKVFKNPPKLEPPEIVQKSGPYSVVKDLMKTPAHITFGQLMTHSQFRKDLYKSLIPKKKTPKTNKRPCQTGLANNSNVTSLICKAQVAGYFINLILDSKSSVSVIAKYFLETIGRKIDEPSTQPMTNMHGDKKKGLGIAKAIPVCINGISIETDMEVSEAKEYIIIVGNE